MDPYHIVQIPEAFLKKIKTNARMGELFKNTDSFHYGNMLSNMLCMICCEKNEFDMEKVQQIHNKINITKEDIYIWLKIMKETGKETGIPDQDIDIMINKLDNLCQLAFFLQPSVIDKLDTIIKQFSNFKIDHNKEREHILEKLKWLIIEQKTETKQEFVNRIDFIINLISQLHIDKIKFDERKERDEIIEKMKQLQIETTTIVLTVLTSDVAHSSHCHDGA